MKLEIGKYYKTRGGWKVLIIWKKWSRDVIDFERFASYYAVHKPEETDEDVPILHDWEGKAAAILSMNEAPTYGKHPADIIKEWKE